MRSAFRRSISRVGWVVDRFYLCRVCRYGILSSTRYPHTLSPVLYVIITISLCCLLSRYNLHMSGCPDEESSRRTRKERFMNTEFRLGYLLSPLPIAHRAHTLEICTYFFTFLHRIRSGASVGLIDPYLPTVTSSEWSQGWGRETAYLSKLWNH